MANGKNYRRRALATAVGALITGLGVGTFAAALLVSAALEDKVQNALRTAGYTTTEVTVDGRDVTVSGEVEAAADGVAVLRIASEVDGVRTVNDRLQLAQPRAAALALTYIADRITLTGSLPPELVDQLVSDARRAFGEKKIEDRIAASTLIQSPDWFDGVRSLFTSLASVELPGLRIDEERFVISGVVTSESQREALLARAGDVVGAYTVDDRLEVVPTLVPTELRIEVQSDVIVIQGHVPDESVLQEIVPALQNTYPDKSISNEVQSRIDVSYPKWIAALTRSVPELVVVDGLVIDANNDNIKISGLVPDENTQRRLRGAVSDILAETEVKLKNRLQVAQPKRTARVHFEALGERVTVTGELSTAEEAESLLDVLQKHFQGAEIDNQLRISDEVAVLPRLAQFEQLLTRLSYIDALEIEHFADQIIIGGVVNTERERGRVEDDVSRLFPSVHMRSRVRMQGEPSRARLNYELNKGKVIVRGLLPNRGAIAEIIHVLGAFYPPSNISNGVRVDDGIDRPQWLAGVATTLPLLFDLERASLEVSDEGVIVSGVVTSADQSARLTKRFKDAFGTLPVDVQFESPVIGRLALINVAVDAEEVLVLGLLQRASVDRLAEALPGILPYKTIILEIDISDDVASPVWIDPLLSLISTFGAESEFNIDIDGHRVRATGSVPTSSIRDAAIAQGEAGFGSFNFEHQLNLLPPLAASVRMIIEDDSVRVVAVVHNENAQQELTGAITSAFTGRRFEPAITVSQRVQPPSWWTALVDFVPALNVVDSGQLVIAGDNAELSGLVRNAKDLASLEKELARAASRALTISNGLTTGADARALANALSDLKLRAIQFGVNSAALTAASRGVIRRVADIITKYPGVIVEIGGHTDSSGSVKSNLRLSRRRAESVRDYLIDSGIGGDRLRAKGYGEDHPIADNATRAGQARNRRIEFRVIEGAE